MKLRHPVTLAGLAFIAASVHQAALANGDCHDPAVLGTIETGKTSLYHTQNGVPRTDLSGVGYDGKNVVFADDGGDTGAGYGFNFVRVTSTLPDADGYNVPLSQVHNDVEAATYMDGRYYITTSLSKATDPASRLTTRFKLDDNHHQIINEESVDLHDSLREALRVNFGDEWYNSWKGLAAKSGGLNIEGLSRSGRHGNRLVFGLRSPLFGGDFPADLHSGNAILAEVKNPFTSHPTWDFMAVDFGGLGVRGMEWIPALDSYVVSAGPVEKATEYALYQVFTDGTVRPLALPGMNQLCRPESVFQQTIGHKDYLVVVSEDSGPECAGVPFTWIRAEIVN